jgi:hypothetical protein
MSKFEPDIREWSYHEDGYRRTAVISFKGNNKYVIDINCGKIQIAMTIKGPYLNNNDNIEFIQNFVYGILELEAKRRKSE